MAQGISLHIGLNSVNPAHYAGWSGNLVACEADAKDMQALARKKKFSSTLLLTKNATAEAILGGIADAAKKLKSGDIFFLSYSGHGGQVPDTNGDEQEDSFADGMDETWVAYDRQIVDDELFAAWGQFAQGVRVLMLSDSCHSGTMARFAAYGGIPGSAPSGLASRFRAMPPNTRDATYRKHKKLYDSIQAKHAKGDRAPIGASVLLISGCQDNQYSMDGSRNGLFTETLLRVWNGGKFKGSYRRFHKSIVGLMPISQTPNYYPVGVPNQAFERQTPFSI